MRLILLSCTLAWAICHGGRVSAEPELEWVRQFGTPEYESTYDVFPDRLGNVFVSGRTWGNLAGVNAGESDAFLTQFDSTGAVAWTRQLGTNGSDAATGVAADGLGNVYISGWTHGSLGGPHAGDVDLFISKYDAIGQQLWTKQFGASSREHSYAMTIDSSGNLFITGETHGSLGGPNGGGIDGSPSELEDAFVSKFDADGTLLWTRQSSRPGRDMSHDVAVDATGNIYTTGTARILNSDWVATVTKYDPSGTELWAKEFVHASAVATEAKGVAIDDLGNVFISGDFGAERSNPSDQNAFYCNFDANGELSWCNDFAGGGSSIAHTSESVSTDGLGNAYFTGYVTGSDSFDPYQQYVSKFAADGTHGWTERIPSDITAYARAVAADRAGSVYFTGELSGGVAFLGKLRLNDVLAPGDTNGDGLVDLTDLNNVRNHFGGTGLGDTNADGVVDLEDLNAVRNNFGTGGGAAPVPEPATGFLLAAGCVAILLRRVRRASAIVINGLYRDGLPACVRRTAFILAIVGHGAAARAETVEWIRQFGTTEMDFARGVSTDGMGGAYVVGTSHDNMGPAAGVQDIFLHKYDVDGARRGVRTIGNVASDDRADGVWATSSMNIFVGGVTTGHLVENSGDGSAFIGSYDSLGQMNWLRQFGNAGQSKISGLMGSEQLDAVWGVGHSSGNAMVVKYSLAGEHAWTREFGSQYPVYAEDVVVNGQGDIFVVGHTLGSLESTNSRGEDVFVTKFDDSGTQEWIRQFGSDEYYDAGGIAIDRLGNVVVAGGTATGDASDAFLSKYDEDGSLLWYREFGASESGDAGGSIAVDSVGNIFVGGATRGNWGGPTVGSQDAFLSKFDAEGNLLWTQKYGTSGGDSVTDLTTDGLGNYWVVGQTRGLLGDTHFGLADDWMALVRDPITPGDTNGDGVVDLADLNNVRNHFGGIGLGDTNADGIVDLEDLNAVRNNFGAGGGAASVPEPATGFLLAAGCLAILLRRARRASEIVINGLYRDGLPACVRRTAFILAVVGHVAAARAETVEWIRQFGTPMTDSAEEVAVDPFGDILVVGNMLGQSSNPSAGTDDFFVRKYDATGAEIWARQFGTTARDVSAGIGTDALGNIFVAGNTTGSLAAPNDGQPGPSEPFLSKLDTNGDVLWTQQFGSLYSFRDVAVDLHGDAIFAGSAAIFQGSAGILSKIGATGEQIWTQRIFNGTDYQIGNSIATDRHGNVFVAGSSARSAFLNMYDVNGGLLWTRVFEMDEVTWGYGVAADNAGNVYVAGSSEIGEAGVKYDGFLRKYDESGTLLWSREFGHPDGTESFSDIALDELGNVFVVGSQRDPGPSTPEASDALVVMYDADGEMHWSRRLASGGLDSARSVAMAGGGSIFVAGETFGDMVEDSYGGSDAFLAKIRLNDTITPGDTNGDGLVDLADLNNVRNHFGGTGLGDTNADGIVDLEDLNAVRNNFGAGGAAAVPEPSMAVLLSVGGLTLGLATRLRRARQKERNAGG